MIRPVPPLSLPRSHPFRIPHSRERMFLEDFQSYGQGNSGTPTWTVINGTWLVDSQRYLQNAAVGEAISLVARPEDWRGIEMSTDVLSLADVGYPGIIVRRVAIGQYYHLRLNMLLNLWQLYRWPGFLLAQGPFTAVADRWYNLKMRFEEARIDCWVNGDHVTTQTDTTYASGHFGLRTYDGKALFDNVVCTRI